MQKVQTDKSEGKASNTQYSECQSPLLLRNNSMQSQPSPKLIHKSSIMSLQSVVSVQSKNSVQQSKQPGKTSKLQIIKDKVSSMVSKSTKISLDSIKMQSIQDLQMYINIIQKPQDITHFSKNNSRLGDEMILKLNLPSMKKLTYLSLCKTNLNLENSNISFNGFYDIINTDLPDLRMLYLAHNKIGQCNQKEIKQNKLNLLSLTNNGLTENSIRVIKRSFINIQSLTLKLNNIKTAGLKEILNGDLLRLKYLHLESCGLDAESMELFLKQGIEKQIPKLISIYLNYNMIKSQGLQNLLKSPIAKTLQVLHLQGSLSKQSLSAFKQHYKSLTKLNTLNLSNNSLTVQLIKDFTQIKLPHVDLINLQNNCLTIECLNLLSRSEFPWLHHLLVNNNPQILQKINSHKSLPYTFYCVQKKNYNKVLFNL